MKCLNSECKWFNTGTCILGIAKDHGECNPVYVKCSNCGSIDIINNEFSPEEKPYVIRTEHTCRKCKHYWYEED